MDINLKKAIYNNDLSEVQKLILSDVNLEQPDKETNLFPLEYATKFASLDIVKILMQHTSAVGKAFLYSIKENKIDLAEELIKSGTNLEIKDDYVEFMGYTPLICAARFGSTKLTKMLIESGSNLEATDSQNKTALIIASQFGQNSLILPLLKAGANPNHQDSFGNTALSYACRGHYIWIINKLKQAGASFKCVKEISLIEASRTGNLEKVKSLIKSGTDVNATGVEGYTALELACYHGYETIVDELIRAGSDINLKSAIFTPLIAASYSGHLGIVKKLIKHGANPKMSIGTELDALAYAQEGGHEDIITFLQNLEKFHN
ncbi:MAG: ankyrin repeat domain-containing protein [Chlorogloeopsis fritschii C42_A2020_084]|uniref:ankyrin repeat domain-containing protein n=1 Tax=Chlorogloeopsis fritschii TaxID=1124 RepID=UPI0019ECC1EF|nr:ankyrin repeat domain-containing protein [Chlorogloeopsis fritschii]MBF2005679.1 ankyrin repeat domain-containing protein [Chlorogloeopsis fritschii C42_A2020_084]